jgi:Tfp pilus assembly protein PilN
MFGVYYKINLNKASNRLDQFAQKQKRRVVMAIGAYFLSIAVISGFVVYKSMQSQKRINSLENTLAQIDSEIERLKASSEFLSPEDIYTLAELANNRLTWTEKLDVLGRILPKDVTLTGLDYDYQVNSLTIKGITKVNPRMKDLDLINSIIDIIKADPNFSSGFGDIKFGGSDRIKHQNQELISFEISCVVGQG